MNPFGVTVRSLTRILEQVSVVIVQHSDELNQRRFSAERNVKVLRRAEDGHCLFKFKSRQSTRLNDESQSVRTPISTRQMTFVIVCKGSKVDRLHT